MKASIVTTGSVVVASMEGTRPILVELQALISPTTFGTPRRATIGVDHNRVSLLLAVLEKRAGLHLMGHDVFVNVVGGLRLDEPATDLVVRLAQGLDHLVERHAELVPPFPRRDVVVRVVDPHLRVHADPDGRRGPHLLHPAPPVGQTFPCGNCKFRLHLVLLAR